MIDLNGLQRANLSGSLSTSHNMDIEREFHAMMSGKEARPGKA
jgi:hypothetical protein